MARTSFTEQYFGSFWREVNFPRGRPFDELTLSDAAAMEYGAIERILMHAFGQYAESFGPYAVGTA
jgi:hypothetical protein